MRTKNLIILIILICLVAGGIFTLLSNTENKKEEEAPASSEKTEGTEGTEVKAKTIDSAAVNLAKISTQNCYAYAPSGWTNIESMQSVGFGYDALSADGTSMASYGMLGLPVDFATFYGLTSAESVIESTLSTLGYTNFSWQSDPVDVGDGYKTRIFQAVEPQKSRPVTGIYLYKTWDLPDGGFIVALRSATTYSDKWEENSALTFNVALSMRCSAKLQPSNSSSTSSNDGISDMIADSYEKRQSTLDKTSSEWSEGMLGYENVYSPSTGDHYWAPLDSKWETGPDGPGYYRVVNPTTSDVEKLENGFGY